MSQNIIKKIVDYCHHKNFSCLNTNQVKTRFLRKSKVAKKIYKLPKTKKKFKQKDLSNQIPQRSLYIFL